ncbi:hypothetical protein RclHR1_07090003 [Rhizophagus clarus]|uniref:Uncharacterized protein n=1 Tax=Rhizophagus clarus TaxID=94130 RepID=A0A2Z6RVM5_9GLOM|nr:hypothetical protein RclHR1_07090003 [Rhizophagus clarus]
MTSSTSSQAKEMQDFDYYFVKHFTEKQEQNIYLLKVFLERFYKSKLSKGIKIVEEKVFDKNFKPVEGTSFRELWKQINIDPEAEDTFTHFLDFFNTDKNNPSFREFFTSKNIDAPNSNPNSDV